MAVELSKKQIQEGWQVVKFGEIAKEVRTTTKDPLEDGLEYYVGLEHIDTQSLRIQRKGLIAEENPTFNKRFLPGQILFGRRRAYLKKAAVPDFAGICSGDITVIEAIKGRIISELLPFIVQSGIFFDWAVKNSAGGLSPRVKWKALAEFEFPLAPLKRQKEILDLLKQLSLADKRLSESKEKFSKVQISFYRDYFEKKLGIAEIKNRPLQIKCNIDTPKLREIIDGNIQNGLFVKKEVTKRIKARFLNVQDIYGFPPKTVDTLEIITCDEKEFNSFEIHEGDVIYNRSSLVKDGIGWTYLCRNIDQSTVYDCHLMRVRPNKLILPEYLFLYSHSPWARKYFMCVSQTTTMTTIGQKELGELPVPVPSMNVQLEIVNTYDQILKTLSLISARESHLNILNTRIVSELLSCPGDAK